MLRPIALAVTVVLTCSLFPTPADSKGGRSRPIRVMTRNVYLGGDLLPLAAATTLPALALAGSTLWSQVQATDFPARARALAAEIRDADPVLIGLQEVALWQTGSPDGPPIFGGSPANIEALDFLKILRAELEALDSPYEVVVVQPAADLELPTASGFDARLTLRDVILAKAGLPASELTVTSPKSANFQFNLELPVLGGAAVITVLRGWTSADVTVNRRSFRFINTHLEAFSNCVRTLQALELLADPVATEQTVVLVGDLNSAPNDPEFPEPGCPIPSTFNPYNVLLANEFSDTWSQVNPQKPGFTCCNASDLLNARPSHTERIDHVLARPSVVVYRSRRTGIDRDDRTPEGLWPSDHAGVIAVLAP